MDSDLSRTVQNTVDELNQLLHGLQRLTGQEVLLVGRVEDDYRGHGHLAEEKQKNTAFNLLNLGSTGRFNQRESLDGSNATYNTRWINKNIRSTKLFAQGFI